MDINAHRCKPGWVLLNKSGEEGFYLSVLSDSVHLSYKGVKEKDPEGLDDVTIFGDLKLLRAIKEAAEKMLEQASVAAGGDPERGREKL